MYLVCLNTICAACCTVASCCSISNNSRLTKIVYMFIMMSATALGIIFRYDGNTIFDHLQAFNLCSKGECYGFQAVFRTSFAVTIFFAIMALLVTCNHAFHLGAWLLKLCGFVVLYVISLVTIPVDFFDGYAEVSRVGSVFFLLLQMIILIDFAYDTQDYLIHKINERDEELRHTDNHSIFSNCWKILFIGISFSLIVASITAHGIMAHRYGGCFEGMFFTLESLIAGIILCCLSMLNSIGAGLLPASLVFANMSLLIWNANTNNPDLKCNPDSVQDSTGRLVVGVIFAILSISWNSFRIAGSAYNVFSKTGSGTMEAAEQSLKSRDVHANSDASAPQYQTMDFTSVDSDGKAIQPDLDAAETGNAKHAEPARLGSPVPQNIERNSTADDNIEQEKRKDPGAIVFHIIMALAGLYLAMLLTNWGNTDYATQELNGNPQLSRGSMWANVASNWGIQLLFLWTLVAPAVGPRICPGRDFS